MELLYGMDPLCGWCFGIGPAIRRVMADHPGLRVTPVLAGLVTGARIGPYAEMEGYIRGASQRLRQVTGRAPAPAFFDLIRRPGVRADSGPPAVAIGAVLAHHPAHAADFALRVTEAHFQDGADLNQPATHAAILGAMGLNLPLPDLARADLAAAAWARGRALGLASFPSLWMQGAHGAVPLPLTYEPAALSALVGRALRAG